MWLGSIDGEEEDWKKEQREEVGKIRCNSIHEEEAASAHSPSIHASSHSPRRLATIAHSPSAARVLSKENHIVILSSVVCIMKEYITVLY